MPRFSANLGFLFADRPDLERVEAAAAAGFRAVEMHWPYAVPASSVRAALARNDLTMLGLNTVVGNSGEFGLGALAGREEEFRRAVEQALSYGREIGAAALHCMAGVVTPDVLAEAENVFVNNLRLASDMATEAGMTILIEPINHRNIANYALFRVEQAASIIERVGRRNVKIMFDCYHVQIMQGDLIRRFEAHRDLIGHVQIAAVPSRAEPDNGELNYPEICRAFERVGYTGWFGAEYKPRTRTEDGLGWLRAWSEPGTLETRS
jgi:hydroxypyruvate isomerase